MDDATELRAELDETREENQRIKDALRQWQTDQAPTAYDLAAGDWVTGRATTADRHSADRRGPEQLARR